MDALIASSDQLLCLRVALLDQLPLVRGRECLPCRSLLTVRLLASPGTDGNQCILENSFKRDPTKRDAGRIEAEEVCMHGFS